MSSTHPSVLWRSPSNFYCLLVRNSVVVVPWMGHVLPPHTFAPAVFSSWNALPPLPVCCVSFCPFSQLSQHFLRVPPWAWVPRTHRGFLGAYYGSQTTALSRMCWNCLLLGFSKLEYEYLKVSEGLAHARWPIHACWKYDSILENE